MQKLTLLRFILTTRVVSLLLHAPLRAQVLLKPTGGNALPLRTKTLNADATIQGQFAVTRLTLLFQNETSARIEADFVYTLPKDTLVTYFAYWFGDEKVVARVVEKERAAAIYQYIPSRMRDPALIELIGKSTFRARIFPVMPNADLKVEMTLVQALPSTANGAAYTLPLRVTTKTDALEAVNVSVRVRRDARIKAVENSYGLPVERDGDGYRIQLTGTNFRPQKDLRIGVIRPVRPLQAAAYAAPSSRGGDGFFALAVTPNAAGERPVVRVQGVRTYGVIADRPHFVRANQALMVVGRYKGSGTATVTLTEGARTVGVETVPFPAEPEPNNVASKLWAARRIEQLSGNRGNEEAVVTLSKRYTLPSKFTSWLAIPQAEKARYEREQAEAEISVAARQLVQAIRQGQGDSRRAQRIRARLTQLCRKTGADPRQRLRNEFSGQIQALSSRIAYDIVRGRSSGRTTRRLRADLNRLCRQVGLDARQEIARYRQQAVYDEADRVAQQLSQKIAAGRGEGAKARWLRARLNRLGRQGAYPPGALRNLLAQHLDNRMYELSNALAGEVIEQGNNKNARRLMKQYTALARQAGLDPHKELLDNWTWRLNGAARELVTERRRGNPDEARIVSLERQLADLTRLAGAAPQAYIQSAEFYIKNDEFEQARDALLAERRKAKPDQRRIHALETRFRWQHDRAQPMSYVEDRLKRLAVEVEMDRLEKTQGPPTPEVTPRRAQLTRRFEELRARMGDPLIQVEAPPDALQVVALLPGGEIKRLVWNGATGRWEARFDIPTYAQEGTYVITVVIVDRDGTRRTLTLRYHVDVTPPTGVGRAAQAAEGASLRLEFDGGADTARVSALLPWSEQVTLRPSGQGRTFFALVPLPAGQPEKATQTVTFIVTDQAHNRSAVTVEVSP